MPLLNVRFTPESGHVQCSGSCLLWANSGLMHCSKQELCRLLAVVSAVRVSVTLMVRVSGGPGSEAKDQN